MSVCNVALQPGAGYLMSDAGVWDAEGRLDRLQDKLVTLPSLQAAMVWRGVALPPGWATWEGWRHFTSQADLLAQLPNHARRMKEFIANRFPGHDSYDVEVTVVRWDHDKGAPVAAQLGTADPSDHLDGYLQVLHSEGLYQPYTWLDLPALIITPTIDAWAPSWPALRLLEDERRFNVPAWAPSVVSAQRDRKPDNRSWEFGSTVAGWVDMAKVTADGVTVERVIDWPEDR